jgi:hypothetical protein
MTTKPLKAGGEPATPPTKEDLRQIHQRQIEAAELHRRVDKAVLDDALANGPPLAKRLAGEG